MSFYDFGLVGQLEYRIRFRRQIVHSIMRHHIIMSEICLKVENIYFFTSNHLVIRQRYGSIR